jgi:LmbE family N-acetylglucosaminyl deacetylase
MNTARQVECNDHSAFYPSDMFDMPMRLWTDVPQLQNVVPIECDALVHPRQRAVIVATHADDDVLGFGGLLQLLRALKRQVTIIYVSSDSLDHGDDDDVHHAGAEARRRLALPPMGIRCVHGDFPYGAIGKHSERLTRFLSLHLQPGDAVFTTWRDDGHADHEAVADAVAIAARDIDARVHEVPMWAWQWATPAVLPWERACLLWLDPETHERKCDAIDAMRAYLTSAHHIENASENVNFDAENSRNNQASKAVGSDVTALFTETVLERLQQPFELIFL